MSNYPHIIMRQCLEIEIPDKKHQQEVQARIQNLAENLLNDLLNATFSKVVPDDVVISIPELYISLGEIDQPLLEKHFVQKIQDKLLIAIQEEVRMAMQDPFKKQIIPLFEAKVRAVKHYLLHGYFAWWIPTTHEKAIEDLYVEIYHENPKAIQDLWLEISQQPAAIERFLNQFASSTIQLSLELVHSTYAPYLLDLADDFKNLQPIALKARPTSRYVKLPTTLQDIVLSKSFQAIANSTSIQEVILLDVCLQEVAQGLEISYAALLNHLSKELAKHPPVSFKTHIAHQVNRIYESKISRLTPSTKLPISSLIKQLDQLLSQKTPINNQQLDHTIRQILTHKKNPIVKELAKGYLQSTTQANQLIRYLSPDVFLKLIEVVQPNIKAAWKLIQKIWSGVMPLKFQEDALIERLTVKFLATSPSSQQEETAYIAYIMRELPVYIGDYLKNCEAFIQKNEENLRQAHGNKLVSAIVAKLPKTRRPVKEATNNSSTIDIGQYLLTALEEFSINLPKHPLIPSLSAVLEITHKAITSWLADTTHLKGNAKQLQTSLENIIHVVMKDAQQADWAISQLDIWVQSLTEKASHTNSIKGLSDLRDKLEKIVNLNKLLPPTPFTDKEVGNQSSSIITKPMVKDLLADHILPINYSTPTAFLAELAQQVTNQLIDQQEVLEWIRQYPIQAQLWQSILPATRGSLLDALLPLPLEVRKAYHALLIQADVLSPATPLAKKLLLDQIFLEVASKYAPTTETHFLHLTLAAVAGRTQLSISEVYQRVVLAAKKLTLPTAILGQIEKIASLFLEPSTSVLEPLTSPTEKEINNQSSHMITKSMVQDLLTDHILPISYPTPNAFLAELAQQVKNKLIDQQEVLGWMRQYTIEPQLWQSTLPTTRGTLLDALLPLPVEVRKDYYALLIQADVLRPVTLLAKELLLDEIFLEVAIKYAPTTTTHLLQLSLAALADQAQLSTSEVYQRVVLVARKLTLPTAILDQIEKIASLFLESSTSALEPLTSPAEKERNNQPNPMITRSMVQDLLTNHILPIHYPTPSIFLAELARQVTSKLIDQQEVLGWMRQYTIPPQLWQNTLPATRGILVDALLPLPVEVRKDYYALLTQADVLRPATLLAKELLLDKVFLEVAIKYAPTTTTHLLQLSLAALADQAHLSTSEVYQRVALAAKKLTLPTAIFDQIEKIASLFLEPSKASTEKKISQQPSPLITKSMVQDLLAYHILPINYPTPSAFLAELAQQVKNKLIGQQEVLAWIQQYPIQPQLWQNTLPTTRSTLLDALLPLPADLRKKYYALFMKADVLRPTTPLAKELLLDEIFLEVASNHAPTTKIHFLQLTLLALADHAQLSKSEVYRRAVLVAQKISGSALTLGQLQETAPFFISQANSPYEIESAFLPIYQSISSFLAPQRLTPELYTQVELWLQEIMVQQETSVAMQASLQQFLNKVLPTLSAQKKQQLEKIILANLQLATTQRIQKLLNDWTYFMQTSELPKEYNSPSSLLSHWLDPLLAQSNIASPDKQLAIEQLNKILHTPYTRKRLIATLSTQDLEKIVQLITPTNSNTVIDWIQHIYGLWSFAGSTTDIQDDRVAWWDAALSNMVEKAPFDIQNWLKDSLIDFAGFLKMQPATLLVTLLSTKPPHIQAHTTHIVLQKIQQQIHQSIGQVAQKNWPTQPILQELYQAFTQGLGHLQDRVKLEKIAKQIGHLMAHELSAFKRFLYTYPNLNSLCQQIVYHLPNHLVAGIIKLLDPSAYPFIQQHTTFINLAPPSFYQEQGIDVFSWRKQHELATLTYLLGKQNASFNQEKYLTTMLHSWKAYQPQLQSILRALITYHQQQETPAAMRQFIQLLENILPQYSSPIEKLELEQAVNTQTSPAQKSTNIPQLPDNKSDQELKLYIKNCGLILVWPFIEDLFNKQGLLEKGVFIDEVDHNNALHTLQYMVTEELSTPDWRLILNKLLCGMPYDEVAFAGYYLRDEKNFAKNVLEKHITKQNINYPKGKKKNKKKLLSAQLPEEIALLKKNTEELLTIVLDEWVSLQKLKKYEPYQQGFGIQAFRKYILQRDGMLQYVFTNQDEGTPAYSAEGKSILIPPGYWHLTITSEEHDADIFKTPWPIKSVQLPFMREMIVVSWLS